MHVSFKHSVIRDGVRGVATLLRVHCPQHIPTNQSTQPTSPLDEQTKTSKQTNEQKNTCQHTKIPTYRPAENTGTAMKLRGKFLGKRLTQGAIVMGTATAASLAAETAVETEVFLRVR